MKSIFPLYSSSILTRSGNSSRHGPHHVAQKLTSRGLPPGLRSCLTFSSSICVTLVGPAARGFVSAGVFCVGSFVCGQEFARNKNAQRLIRNTTRESLLPAPRPICFAKLKILTI